MLRTYATLALVSLVACGGEAPGRTANAPRGTTSGTSVERYFPLDDGNVYHYVTRDGGETGMLVAKVHRRDAQHGELRVSNATRRFAFEPDGVRHEGGAYLLKAPLDVGASWAGEHGGTTVIAAVDASVEVPAGRFASCVRTVEDRSGAVRYEATYCPGVGMVRLVVTSGASEGRAELKSYGPPAAVE